MGFVVAAVVAVVKAVVTVVKVVAPIIKAVLPVVAAVVGFVAGAFVGSIMNVGSFDVGGGGGTGGIGDIGSESEAQQGVLLTKTGSNRYIPIVYGYRKVGGIITFAETGSTDNKYLWVAYVFSEGQVEGLREVFIDDYQLPSNIIEQLNVGNTVDISEGKYSDRVQLQFFHGTYHSNPDNSNVGTASICKDAPSWKESMVYNGLAVMFARYEWKKIETQEDADSNPFGGSIPELQACILGKKVARLDIDNPSAYTYDTAPKRYSSNPAEHLLDYMRNPRYGKGLDNKDFDWEFWKTAAAKCNTVVQYVDSGTSGPILTSNMVVDTQKKLFANTRTLLANFRGYMPYVQGKYRLKIEDAGNATDILSGVATIVNTFDEDNIVGTVTYTGIEKTSKYNSVKVGFVDPDKKWSNSEVVYPETDAERQQYIDEDNGRVNQGEAFYPGITNYAIAKDMARLIFNKSRFQETCSLSVSSEGLELEPGDNVYIQSQLLDFTTTPWRIVSIDINPNMTVDIACVRNRDDIYPHTRVGEEDIVLPPYIPRGAQIYYPAVQSQIPVGLVPPTNARVPTVYEPPTISAIAPSTIATAGVNNITVYGNNFYNGATAVFVGADGTEYTPNDIDRISRGRLDIETIATMTDANQPYSVKITNASAFGGLSVTLPNCLNVDNTQPPQDEDPIDNPPIVDPPIIEDPDLNQPPEVTTITPKTFGAPGVNTITVTGNYFRPGVDALFYNGGGTSYTPNSVTRISQREIQIETVSGMTVPDQPYSLRIFNTSDYGGNDILLINILNVDGTNPPAVTDPDENNVYVVPSSAPQVEYTYPGTFEEGVNQITVVGTHFYPGMNAVIIGNDGTVYTPTSTTYDSDTHFFLETTAAMTSANNPYAIRLTNGLGGGGQTRIPNAFSVDAVAPPVEDPVIEDPGDDDYVPPDTPNPSDPPDDGESDNNQPENPPEVYGADDVIEITNIEYITNNDQNFVYLKVTFVGSDNPMYEQVKFYWHRAGTNEPYYDYVVTTDPGPGNEYTFLIGDPLIPGQTYDIFSRIKYETGEYSTKTGRVTITPTFGGSTDPVDFVEDSDTAWPTAPGEPNQRRDDIPLMDLLTYLNSGVPRDPRQVKYTVTQPTDTREPNFEIEGLWIIYKPSTQSYWFKTDEYFANDYVPGQPYDFAYYDDSNYKGPTLGSPQYPDIPTDAEQNYDFIFRFKYKDGRETKQIRYMNVPIEYQNGTYDFNAVGSVDPIIENISDFTINYDPPAPPTNVEDMSFNIAYITKTRARGSDEMIIWLEPPAASYRQYWRGFEVQIKGSDQPTWSDPPQRYREKVTDVVSGYTKIYIPYTPDKRFEMCITTIIDKYQRSEYVADNSLTPIYDFGDYAYQGIGTIKSAVSGVGVPTTLAPDGSRDYATVFNFKQLDSALACPYNARWASLIRSDIDDVPAPYQHRYYSSTYDPTTGYYSTAFSTQHINTGYSVPPNDFLSLDEMRIFRRSRAKVINQQQYAYNTYGVGRWEKFVVDMTSDNEKLHFFNLRPALTYRYYNPEFNPNDQPDSALTIPYYEKMIEQIGTEDFIIQLKIDGTYSSRGLLLPRAPAGVAQNTFVELMWGQSPRWVDLDDYNQLPTYYGKNIDQAIDAPTTGLIDYLGNASTRTDSYTS
jgi:hypothetical protein